MADTLCGKDNSLITTLLQTPGPIWLPILVLGLLMWISCRQRQFDLLHPGKIIIGFYFLMSLASLFYEKGLAPSFFRNVTWSSMVGYTALMCLTLIPAFLIKRPDAKSVIGHWIVRPFLLWSLPLVVFALVYLVPFAIDALQQGFKVTRFALNVEKAGLLPKGILTTISVATASYYPIYALLFFPAQVRRIGPFAMLATTVGICLPIIHAAVFGV